MTTKNDSTKKIKSLSITDKALSYQILNELITTFNLKTQSKNESNLNEVICNPITNKNYITEFQWNNFY